MDVRPPGQTPSNDTTAIPGQDRLFVIFLSALALFQAVLLAVTGHGAIRVIAIILAIAGLNVRIRTLAVLAVLIVVNVSLHVSGLAAPFPYRLVYITILVLYGATALAALFVLVFGMRSRMALVLGCAPAVVFIAAEALLGPVAPISRVDRVRWIGRIEPHEVVGEIYPAYGVLRAVYPDNPRGFFDETGRSNWEIIPNQSASDVMLERRADRPDWIRVEIARGKSLSGKQFQLVQAGLSVRADERYELTFVARGDASRPISYGISTGPADGEAGGGGLREVVLDHGWREFSNEMVFSRSDSNAALRFDLGESPGSVELERTVLRRVPSGDIVSPSIHPHAKGVEYSVTFRFNGFSCRGDDYALPRPAGRNRILVLGGAAALGAGVHESDTFAARLERSLNAADQTRGGYDVINCGATGYAVREDRQFYEEIAAQYDPTIVLLTIGADDNLSRRDAERLGYGRPLGKYEELFRTFNFFQNLRHPRQPRLIDYKNSLAEVIKLSEACKARNARLAVVVFRHEPLNSPWSDLLLGLSATLQGTDVPYLDLGQTLLKTHQPDQLVVHRFDRNPNEIAHRLAAAEIQRFLTGHGL